MKAREAAYLALLASFKNEQFVSNYLDGWSKRDCPSQQDYRLAQEIALGTLRMTLALDHLLLQLMPQKKLPLKLKEKVLLRMALYQHRYMTKIPLYAIVNETVILSQRHCHITFTKFLNAILRKLDLLTFSFPHEKTLVSLSRLHSYPVFFVEQLVKDYRWDKTEDILAAGNAAPKVMVRLRTIPKEIPKYLKLISRKVLPIAILEDTTFISEIACSKDFYIQNATPATLISSLFQENLKPETVLDLCSSPGGKILAFHDYYSEAKLFANDISEEKLNRLRENLNKYQIDVKLSTYPGEEYPLTNSFDIVILDVPCSNSGVLNKRAEARWRLTEENLKNIEALQLKLISRAKQLVKPQGQIWYMTCSILKSENERLIETACKMFGLKAKWKETILPNADGWDGGFACVLV